MNPEARKYLAEIGRKGGQKSKRVLTEAQAKAMVAAREKKRRKTKRVTRRANAESSYRSGPVAASNKPAAQSAHSD